MTFDETATNPVSRSEFELFSTKDFKLQCGVTLPEISVAYKTYGSLNRDRSNAILYPTSYGAHHSDIAWLIGPDKILDSSRYFVLIANMFGNGLSTSPTSQHGAANPRPCPPFSHVDNVTAQKKLLTEVFGIDRLAMVYGWSMGAQQAYHWGALYPESVERIAALCGTAKTSPHNYVFLDGLRATLTTDPAWVDNRFIARPERGLKAFGRVYAGWALSQAFYREHLYLTIGYSSLEDFLVRDWEASFLRREPANLLSMLNTWQKNDLSDNETFHGDLAAALGAIKARTLVMPSQTDLYFTPEDCQQEARQLPNAQFLEIPSIWGHRAGNPAKNPVDQQFIKTAVAKLLDS